MFNYTVQSSKKKKKAERIIRKDLNCDICGIIVHGTFNLNRHKQNKHAYWDGELHTGNWKKSLANKWIQGHY